MNAGFANFDTLKKHLLGGGSVKSDTRFDVSLKLLGLGMAAAIENFCSRKFYRAVGITQIFPADRCQFLVNRYPLESVTQVEIKENETDGFVVQTPSPIITTDLASGIIYFSDKQDAGLYTSQVRLTFTGGFWWDTAEPEDAGFPTDLPAGANSLPEDLKLAWLLQCEAVWSKRDKLGLGLVDKPDAQSDLSTLELSPLVKQMLGQYVRLNLV